MKVFIQFTIFAGITANYKPLNTITSGHIKIRVLVQLIILMLVAASCETESHTTRWFDDDVLTIAEYLEKNQDEYSKFYRLVEKCGLTGIIGAYNPYQEDGYTLFLPTDDAIDRYVQENENYASFQELLQDTSFIPLLTRYHVLNNGIRSDKFPYGALEDRTLTGQRLAMNIREDGDSYTYIVNTIAPIIKKDLDMTNGYIHVISEVLQEGKISAYDWIQEQEGFSILAHSMELAEIKNHLWADKYTIFAEHDSIYKRHGITSAEDLVERVGNTKTPITNTTNSFYQFVAYHFILGEYFFNDFYWGRREYQTMSIDQIVVDGSDDIQINPGLINYGTEISDYGDTIEIDFIRPIWGQSNIFTNTGTIHTIDEVLVIEGLVNRFLNK